MAKSQFKNKNRNSNNNPSNPYNKNQNGNHSNKMNRGNNHNKSQNRPQQHKQKESTVKGPLFDKSKLIPGWKITRKIGPGFINGQNTCFLNSVLECLTYTAPLAQYLLQAEHKKNCRLSGYCALCAMELHVRRCLKDPKSFTPGAAILPSYFTSNLKAISKTLRLGRQEDAHEFYMFLLSAFQKSATAGLGKLPLKVEQTTLIHQIFGGRLRSQVKCYNCKAVSDNFEGCLDLSVDLTNANSLHKTLENFIRIDEVEGYKCDACKKTVTASKQMTINKTPMMLTVHLKRFAFDLERGYMRKINTTIKYPQKLDLSRYTSKDSKVTGTHYSLYAVVVHLGHGCDSGHYYAYVKSPEGKWYCMDDEDVQPASIDEVLSQNAYMLFYQQDEFNIPKTANTTTTSSPPLPPVVEPTPPPVVTPIKPVLKDITKPTPTTEVEPAGTKRVRIETVDSDNPTEWVSQSADKPFRSLRGKLSPPTYGAAVSDESAWHERDLAEFLDQQKSQKRRRFRKTLEAKKVLWNVQDN
ncbi:hypothetical protein EDC94DRAFT_637164 [Helicostylum pulchrum]|nr:hypothetical protein EDC94DRAFT_637164 [Helicostylum pulchrum]